MFDRYSVIDMFGPFYGENWHPPEISNGITFRWTGLAERSTVRIPSLGARDLRLRWTLPILPQEHQVENLYWSVDDRQVTPKWAMRAGYVTLWADVQATQRELAMNVSIGVPHRIQMTSENLDDTRTLGIAVHKLEVFALDTEVLGVEAERLKAELDMREREIADLRASNSWKLSQPLRWLKASLSGK